MPLPGLVAYGSDSDSDGSDTEEANVAVATVPSSSRTVDDNISDEEDFVAPANAANADADLFDVPAEPDLLSLISEKLPHAKLKSSQTSFVDDSEDISSIPQKKDYGDQPEEPPAKKKKKREGPVKIVLPALAKLDEEEEERGEKVKIQPSKSGSGLFSILPAPKNSFTRKPSSSVMASESAAATPALAAEKSENNLKPQGVRRVGLVPHRVANPIKQTPKTSKSDSENDDDDDDDYLNVNSSSYFHDSSHLRRPSAGVGPSININPVPGAAPAPSVYKYEKQPAPGPAPAYTNADLLGPAVAPYPPPEPSYPEPSENH